MGTQQILLIVLSVIIVGVAVGVGFQMFGAQAENANKQACQLEIKDFFTTALAFYKTPEVDGGGGYGGANWTVANIIAAINRGTVAGSVITTDNGAFTFALDGSTLTITCDPKEAGLANFSYAQDVATQQQPVMQ